MLEAIEMTKDYTSFSMTECDLATDDVVVQETKWQKVMDKEIESIKKKCLRELTTLPKDLEPIGVKCVYKTKKIKKVK